MLKKMLVLSIAVCTISIFASENCPASKDSKQERKFFLKRQRNNVISKIAYNGPYRALQRSLKENPEIADFTKKNNLLVADFIYETRNDIINNCIYNVKRNRTQSLAKELRSRATNENPEVNRFIDTILDKKNKTIEYYKNN